MADNNRKNTAGNQAKDTKTEQEFPAGYSIEKMAMEYLKAHPEFAKNGGHSETESAQPNPHFGRRQFTEFLSNIEASLCKIETVLGWIPKRIQSIRSAKENAEWHCSTHVYDDEYVSETTKKLYQLYRNMVASMSQLYCVNCSMSEVFPVLFDDDRNVVCEPEYPLSDYVDVRFVDDNIIVKTPHLASRYHAARHGSRGTVYEDFLHFYSREVAQKMANLDIKNLDLTKKIVMILSVYPSSKRLAADPDNLDTKKIVDAICDHLPGQDNAGFCTFISLARFDNSIEPGTYFVVFEDTCEAINVEEKIGKIREEWRYKNLR